MADNQKNRNRGVAACIGLAIANLPAADLAHAAGQQAPVEVGYLHFVVVLAVFVLAVVVAFRARLGATRPKNDRGRPMSDTSVTSGAARRARTYKPQGLGRPKPGRSVPDLRARVARTRTPVALLVPGGDRPCELIMPSTVMVNGEEFVNPVEFLITQTVETPGERLWFRDLYQVCEKHAKLTGRSVCSIEQLSRAATALGWKRGKSCDRYFKDRKLKLDPPTSLVAETLPPE